MSSHCSKYPECGCPKLIGLCSFTESKRKEFLAEYDVKIINKTLKERFEKEKTKEYKAAKEAAFHKRVKKRRKK